MLGRESSVCFFLNWVLAEISSLASRNFNGHQRPILNNHWRRNVQWWDSAGSLETPAAHPTLNILQPPLPYCVLVFKMNTVDFSCCCWETSVWSLWCFAGVQRPLLLSSCSAHLPELCFSPSDLGSKKDNNCFMLLRFFFGPSWAL